MCACVSRPGNYSFCTPLALDKRMSALGTKFDGQTTQNLIPRSGFERENVGLKTLRSESHGKQISLVRFLFFFNFIQL